MKRFIFKAIALCLAPLALHAAGVTSYSTTPSSNNSAPPNGAPENMAPSAVNDVIRQVMTDIAVEAQKNQVKVLASVSGTNTITGSMAPDLTSYSAGMLVVLTPAATNTGATTLNIDSLGALDIQKLDGDVLIAGDLVIGIPALLVLDSGADDFILINEQSAASNPVGANPSATIGLTTTNGSASTFMPSDAAPALSQGIAPTWTGQHTWSLSLLGPSGSAAAPAFASSGDPDTGMYAASANQLGFATDGVLSTLLSDGRVYSGAGSEAFPTYSFNADTDTGIFRDTSDEIAFATNGTKRAIVTNFGSTSSYVVAQRATQSTGEVGFALRGGSSGTDWFIYQPSSSNSLILNGNSGNKATFDTSGNLTMVGGYYSSAPSVLAGGPAPLRLVAADSVGDNYIQAYSSDGSTGRWYIGNSGSADNDVTLRNETANKKIVLQAAGSSSSVELSPNQSAQATVSTSGLLMAGATGGAQGSGTVNATGLYVNGSAAWHSGNDGASSGLDADLLDSVSSASFARVDAATNFTTAPTISGNTIAQETSGTFTATFDEACTTDQVITIDWQRSGQIVTLQFLPVSPCTGDTANYIANGNPIPAALRPAQNSVSPRYFGFVSGGTPIEADVVILTNGNISFGNSVSWTSSGSRDTPGSAMHVTYMLGNP